MSRLSTGKGTDMETDIDKLRAQIAAGEDGTHQFKENITNPESLAAEIVAFSNSEGGCIYIGVSDKGELKGLAPDDVRRINQLIANTATNLVRSPVSVQTENIVLENGRILILLTVPKGLDKPYFDKNGVVWLKNGSDKRRINSSEELQRLFQSSHQLHADEVPTGARIEKLDALAFREFLERVYQHELPDADVERTRLLKNLNLATEDGFLNLACVLMFTAHPEWIVPQFSIKAIRYPGNAIHAHTYLDSQDFEGPLPKIYRDCHAFIMRNLHRIQAGQGINAPGTPEVPPAVFEELLVNALVHRDYFISAPVRIFIYDNRIEIISPGHLPNNLTTEKIKTGNANLRNPILASFVAKGLLPYHGLGTGIRRALDAWPDIEFCDDRENNLFTAVVQRHASAVCISQDDSEKLAQGSKMASSPNPEDSEKGAKSSEKEAFPAHDSSEKLEKNSEKSSEKGSSLDPDCSEKPEKDLEERSESLPSRSQKILALLRAHPELSARQMAETLNISARAVEKHLAALRQKGKLSRIGPARGGRWELL